MGDLFDEAKESTQTRVADNVGALGGDLLDEAGIMSKDMTLVSDRFKQTPATPDRAELLKQINDDMGTLERFLVGAGRGMTTIGRAVGVAEPEDPATRQGFEMLAEESPAAQIGEIVGEAAPFMAAAPLGGAGLATRAGGKTIIPAAQRMATRFLAGAGLGAAEGAAIARGKGGDTNKQMEAGAIGSAVGGTLEAVLPVVGRILRGTFNSVMNRRPQGPLLTADGRPTPEAMEALNRAGLEFEDITEQAFTTLRQAPEGVDIAQAARRARFESQGIPATTGDITQNMEQQTREQRLLNTTTAPAGAELREMKAGQSRAFVSAAEELAASLGVSDEAGEAIKAALIGRKKMLRTRKNALYAEAFEKAPELSNIPVMPDQLFQALPDAKSLRRAERAGVSQVGGLRELLVEFGLDDNPDILAKLAKQGIDPEPLTLGNAEEFRQGMKALQRADQTGTISAIAGDVVNKLDDELNLIAEQAQGRELPGEVVNLLKEARATTAHLKTEFAPDDIVGKLVDVQKKSGQARIEASQVVKHLVKDSTPVEAVQRTVSSLSEAGDPGKKAIRDLQASIVLVALDEAFKAPSRKFGGVETIGGNQFARAVQKIGDDKLAAVFGDNPEGLRKLKALVQTAKDIEPEARAIQKGSAAANLDIATRILSRTAATPLIGDVVGVLRAVRNAGGDERAARQALDGRPEAQRVITYMEREFPAILAAIGVSAAVEKTESE